MLYLCDLAGSSRRRWNVEALLACALALLGAPLARTQQTSQPPPDTIIKGSEHPDQFPRRQAFYIFSRFSKSDPADAPHLQERARSIELNSMGLSTEDAAALEQAVETFRVQEKAIDDKVTYAISEGGGNHQGLIDLQQSREKLINIAAQDITLHVSRVGHVAIRQYIERIVSKSQISTWSSATQ